MKNSGFSLVELSIVLVILGLLTGGVLTGQSLIRASELRAVTSEFNKYETAFMTFKGKYFALPGDMTNATDFWQAADPTPATCATTASTDGTTCDGNGDGAIKDTSESNEFYRAAQHLANAGLIEGTYDGISGSTTLPYVSRIGVNTPASKLSGAGHSFQAPMNITGNAKYFDGNYTNRIDFGAEQTADTSNGAILKPQEAWNIDSKIDDSIPGTGIIRAMKNTSTAAPNCTTTDVVSTSRYNLADDAIRCGLVFIPGF